MFTDEEASTLVSLVLRKSKLREIPSTVVRLGVPGYNNEATKVRCKFSLPLASRVSNTPAKYESRLLAVRA